MTRTLAVYYQRLLHKTEFVHLHGIPCPRDRSGRAGALKVPLDKVYIQLQAIANKEDQQKEKAEEEHIAPQMGDEIAENNQSKSKKEPQEALGIDDLLSTIRTLGEYLYRRGQVYEASARPEPVTPQAAFQEHKRLVILGAPGSGKSTMLRYLAHRAVEKSSGLLPILLSPRDYATALAHDENLLLQEFALRQATAGDAELYQTLTNAIESGQTEPLWLIDALDEARNWASHAAHQASRLPGQLIVTSRPLGYVGAGLTSLPHFEILPLTETKMDEFLQDWFALLAYEEHTKPETVATQVLLLKAQLDERACLKPLARNPLLLTFIAILYGKNPTQALPHQPAELYRRYVEELFDRWESSREREHAGDHKSISQLLPDHDARRIALDGFHYLGWQLQLTNYGQPSKQMPNKKTLITALSNDLRAEWGTQAQIIAPAIFEFLQETGFLDVWTIEGTEYLAFRHLTFQEHAAAWGIAEAWQHDTKRAWDFLQPRLHHYAWREPILLLAEILTEEQLNELVRRILRAGSRYERRLHRDLRLAGLLLAQNVRLEEKLAQQIISRFEQLAQYDPLRLGAFILIAIYAILVILLVYFMPSYKAVLVAMVWGYYLFNRIICLLATVITAHIKPFFISKRKLILYLKEMGSPALPALFQLYQNNERSVRQAAVNAVGQIGDVTMVPCLIILLSDYDSAVRQAVGHALAQLGEAAVAPLIKMLSDSDEKLCERAAKALGQMGVVAVPALITALSDHNEKGRHWMANALGQVGETAAVPHLIAALTDSNEKVREEAAYALGQLGDATAIADLISALSDSHEKVREEAAYALGQLGDAKTVPYLIIALSDSDWAVREEVIYALGQIGEVKALPHLISALSDQNWHVRWRAAKVLGQIGDGSAVPDLISTLSDSDRDVREQAAKVLGQIGDVAALSLLISALSDKNEHVREQAANALAYIEDKKATAVPDLISTLSDSDSSVREAVATALGKIGHAAAVPDLITALSDSDEHVRHVVVKALGQIGDAAVPPLMTAFSDSDDSLRHMVVKALGEVGGAAVPHLIIFLQDSDWRLRRQAAKALGQTGEAAAVTDLITALSDSDRDVREAVAHALGQIGDATAGSSLITVLQDKHSCVRIAAANALEEIGVVEDVTTVPDLIIAFENNESDVYPNAAKILGQLAKRITDLEHLKQAACILRSQLINEKPVAEAVFDALEQVIERLTILEVEALPMEDPLMEE